MHIAQIISSLTIGGAERLIVTFAKGVQSRDVKLTVISLSDKRSSFIEELEELKVPIYYVPGNSLVDPKRIWKLYQIARREKFDIVHGHLYNGQVLGSIMARMVNIPYVTTIHNTRSSAKRVSFVRRFLINHTMKYHTNRLIAVGDSVANSDTYAGYKFDIITNAVEMMPEISDSEKSLILQDIIGNNKALILIAVGKLIPQKAFPDLISAMEIISQNHPHVKLLIAGGGELYDELQTLIKAKGLEDTIFLLGFRKDIPNLLSASDIFVSSSHWEGLPVSILEAMASGLPIVATDVGDNSKVVTPSVGYIIEAHEPGKLAEAMCKLIEDPGKRSQYGKNAKQRIVDHYSVDRWIDKLLTLYQEEIDKKT